jgi:TolB-like protein
MRQDPRDAGRRLGVDVITAVAVKGNTIRVAPQLIDVDSGRLLWGQLLYGELLVAGQPRDLFAIQDSPASKIVEALEPHRGIVE